MDQRQPNAPFAALRTARPVTTAPALPRRVATTEADMAGHVSVLPPPPPGMREVSVAPLVPDRAWARILFEEATHSHVYQVVEPALSADEKTILDFLRDTLIRTLDGRSALSADDPRDTLVKAIRQAVVDHSIRISEPGARRLEYYLVRDFLGYGPIDVMMRDPMIEDISCDGPGIPLYIFHRAHESVRATVAFADEDELDSFVIRLAQRSRKHISVADPLLDATLPDGSRLQATLSREVTTRGSSFTVRKFRADPMTPPDLMRLGTFSPELAAWFWFAMEQGHSFILAGGTASGKTTSLNAILQFIPPAKKIVSIEDTREINLSHENWIAGVTRSGFSGVKGRGGETAGTIDMYKLLESALRQRPEYLVVGEVRGPEALTLFQAMATGHAVYSTMHADSVPSAVYRLENPPINVPRMMLQTLDVVAIQAQVRIGDRLARRIREVTEVIGMDPETKELLTNTVFEWDPSTDRHRYLGKSSVLEQIMDARHMSEGAVDAEWRRRVALLQGMMKQNVRHVSDVARILNMYYRQPEAAIAALQVEAPSPPGPRPTTVPKPLPVPPDIAKAPAKAGAKPVIFAAAPRPGADDEHAKGPDAAPTATHGTAPAKGAAPGPATGRSLVRRAPLANPSKARSAPSKPAGPGAKPAPKPNMKGGPRGPA